MVFHLRAIAAAAAVAALGAAAPARAAEQQAYAAALSYTTPAVVAAKGDTLRFHNLDAAAQHDIDSDTPGLFDSPLIPAGESTLVRGVPQLNPGNYPFHCSIHAWMRGTLSVADAGGGGGGPSLPNPGDQPSSGGGPDPMTLAPRAKAEPLEGGNWPLYGRDLTNSRHGGPNGPSYNEVADLGPAWSFKSSDGDFTGTPVVWKGTLVAGAGGGSVFALNAQTGKLRWKKDLGETINGSAAIYKGRVYVPLAKPDRPRLVALRLSDGKRLWSRVLDKQKDSDVYGSPVTSRGTVFIGVSALFGELNDPDVKVRGSVVAFNAKNGRRRWKRYLVPKNRDGASVWNTPAVDARQKRLYVGTGNAYHAPAHGTTDSIVALSTRTGRIVRHFQATADDVWNGTENRAEGPDYDFGASPNLIITPKGRRLVGEGQKSGVYWALDRKTMKPVWNAVAGPGTPVVGGVVGSTAYDRKAIYGPITSGGLIWGLNVNGSQRWKSSDGDPLHFAPVSSANGVVYTTTMDGSLTVREATTGSVLNKLPLGAGSWGGVAIAGRSIFVAQGMQGASGYIVSYRVREQ